MAKQSAAGQAKKGLPKRCMNAHAKDARARRWAAGQRRKRILQEQNHARYEKNQRLRAEGKPTPWDLARARRRAARGGPAWDCMGHACGEADCVSCVALVAPTARTWTEVRADAQALRAAAQIAEDDDVEVVVVLPPGYSNGR